MFWDRFIMLCSIAGTTPNAVCKELGLSNATATKWKKGSTPRGATLKKISDRFQVPADYLLTGKSSNGGILFTIDQDALRNAIDKVLAEKEIPQPPDDRWLRYEAQIRELPIESQERLMKHLQAMIEVEKELSQNQ